MNLTEFHRDAILFALATADYNQIRTRSFQTRHVRYTKDFLVMMTVNK